MSAQAAQGACCSLTCPEDLSWNSHVCSLTALGMWPHFTVPHPIVPHVYSLAALYMWLLHPQCSISSSQPPPILLSELGSPTYRT